MAALAESMEGDAMDVELEHLDLTLDLPVYMCAPEEVADVVSEKVWIFENRGWSSKALDGNGSARESSHLPPHKRCDIQRTAVTQIMNQ